MLLATLGASFILTGKRILRAGYGNKDGKGILELVMDLKIKKSTPSFNKLWFTEVLSEWT